MQYNRPAIGLQYNMYNTMQDNKRNAFAGETHIIMRYVRLWLQVQHFCVIKDLHNMFG